MSSLNEANRAPTAGGDTGATSGETQRTAKKRYHKPAVRFERVFEVNALTCGKISSTQASCAHNRKNS